MAVELPAGLHQLGRAEPQGEGEVGAPRALLLGHRLSGFILTISTSRGAPASGTRGQQTCPLLGSGLKKLLPLLSHRWRVGKDSQPRLPFHLPLQSRELWLGK